MTEIYKPPKISEDFIPDFQCCSCKQDTMRYAHHTSNLGNPREIMLDVLECECGQFMYRETLVVKSTKEIIEEPRHTFMQHKGTYEKYFNTEYVPPLVVNSFKRMNQVYNDKNYEYLPAIMEELFKEIFNKAYETFEDDPVFPKHPEFGPKWLLDENLITQPIKKSFGEVMKIPGEIRVLLKRVGNMPTEEKRVCLDMMDRQCFFVIELMERIIRIIWDIHGIVKFIKPTLIDESKN